MGCSHYLQLIREPPEPIAPREVDFDRVNVDKAFVAREALDVDADAVLARANDRDLAAAVVAVVAGTCGGGRGSVEGATKEDTRQAEVAGVVRRTR